MKFKKGFSLVELMIVVAIIGILVAALLPQLEKMITNAKESSAKQSMKALADAITRFNATEPQECRSLQWLVPNYMKELKNDPWGTPYSLAYEDGVIISYGPDGETNPNNKWAVESRDNIEIYYKAKLGISDCKLTLDLDGNGRINNGDRITIFLTKPAKTVTGLNTSTNTANETPVIVSVTDFVFCDRFEDDKTNERWLYNNSPTDATGGTVASPGAGFMVDAAQENVMFQDLSGAGGISSGTVSLIEVDATGVAGTGVTLAAASSDTFVTFEIVAPENFELISDLYVRFAPGSTVPQRGKYRDKRSNVAVANGYNVKVETYF